MAPGLTDGQHRLLGMSRAWSDDHAGHVQVPGAREFHVSVDMWYSTKRTPVPQKETPKKAGKRSDKRQSLSTSAALADGSPRVKEKTSNSWMNVARFTSSATNAGEWRPVTCRLTEDLDDTILNVYGEGNTLQHSIYVHKLRTSDIRTVDRSLFGHPDCLGIHLQPGQGLTTTAFSEPVYLLFPSSDALHLWLVLLRSYACAEIYGRSVDPEAGGLYRMWRQVELQVVQGRNINSGKPVSESDKSSLTTSNESTSVDIDTFCEISLDREVSGRTTVRRGTSAPEWRELFLFRDLPPFGVMTIALWREKKYMKPHFLGSTEIVLANFRRGEKVEGWYPVLASTANAAQIGEIKLHIKVDEELVLPKDAYSDILEVLDQRNYLDVWSELEQKMRLEGHIATNLMTIAVAQNALFRDVFDLGKREVTNGVSPNTLFRGNTIFTKTVELAMTWFGKAFLDASVGSVIRQMCEQGVAIEVEPSRLPSGKQFSPKEHDANVERLAFWCKKFWDHIWAVRGQCPNELRRIFHHIRTLVEKHYPDPDREHDGLKWQTVSAFCFLRFIVPAILNPHLFGLSAGIPPPPVHRSLTLCARVIQTLANLNPNVQKVEHMREVQAFIQDNIEAMIDYIIAVSTPNNDRYFPPMTDTYDRANITHSLRERLAEMPPLKRESIPILPHMLDLPQQLAVLSSAVIRSARGPRRTSRYPTRRPPSMSTELRIEEFALRCFAVEDRALHCVQTLSSRNSASSHRLRGPNTTAAMPEPTSPKSTTSVQPSRRSEHTTGSIGRRRTKSLRPSTAPSPSRSVTTFDPDEPQPAPRNVVPLPFGKSSPLDIPPRSPTAPIPARHDSGQNGTPPSPGRAEMSRSPRPRASSSADAALYRPTTSSGASPRTKHPPPDVITTITVNRDDDSNGKKRKGVLRSLGDFLKK